MSTKCEETVSFIAVCPPTQLETRSSQAQVQAAQRLYCYNVVSSENSLLLKSKASESVSGITTGYFIVEFGLVDILPWRGVRVLALPSNINSASLDNAST
jgi:hypothetical protein